MTDAGAPTSRLLGTSRYDEPSESSLGHAPSERWVFDEDVARVFEDMLRRSIPGYETMRRVVHDVASAYRKRDTDILDLGSSRGDAVAPLISKWGAHNRFLLVETSQPMVEILEKRFEGLIRAGVVEVRQKDLRTGLPPSRASVVQSVLTLQFIPVEYRAGVLRSVYEDLLEGGAFLMVEKVLGSTSELDGLIASLYYGLKRDHGYTDHEIETKRKSLESVLVPLRASWNEDLLRSAGFGQIECIWRYLNFAAWVAVK